MAKTSFHSIEFKTSGRLSAFVMLLFLTVLPVFSQTTLSPGQERINQTDKQGRKQGYWEKEYASGSLQYKGNFKNDKPTGEFTRFYENGVMQAFMVFDDNGIKSQATLFYDNGEKAATGNYINTKKDGEWIYYSFYTNKLVSKETFQNGLKHGISVIYFENGRPSQELFWQNDLKHGQWKQYYENGKTKLQGLYENNEKTGVFTIFHYSGIIDTKGNYLNGNMEGFWEFYDDRGKLVTKVEYKDGRPVNEEDLIMNQQELFKIIESRKGKIPEPDETNLQY